MKLRAVATLVTCLTPGAGLAFAADPAPERIQFDKGKRGDDHRTRGEEGSADPVTSVARSVN